MKKIIFVFVILAVLLFSGCDAMLEVFYPEFADDFEGNNVLTVDMLFSPLAESILDATPNIPLKVQVYYAVDTPGTNQPVVAKNVNVSVIDPSKTISLEFFLAAGTYQVFIWQDKGAAGLTSGDFVQIDYLAPRQFTFTGTEGYNREPYGSWIIIP